MWPGKRFFSILVDLLFVFHFGISRKSEKVRKWKYIFGHGGILAASEIKTGNFLSLKSLISSEYIRLDENQNSFIVSTVQDNFAHFIKLLKVEQVLYMNGVKGMLQEDTPATVENLLCSPILSKIPWSMRKIFMNQFHEYRQSQFNIFTPANTQNAGMQAKHNSDG